MEGDKMHDEEIYYHDHGDGVVHSHVVLPGEQESTHGHPHPHVHTQTKTVINRLARAIGHLEHVKRMVEDGRDCTEVLIQLAAVRSAAGVFAIAGVCAVALPAAVQMLVWIAALKTLELTAALLNQKNAGKFFSAFSAALSVLQACVLFVTALYVISIGIILTVKADL